MYLLSILVVLCSSTLILSHLFYGLQHLNRQQFKNDPSPYQFSQHQFGRPLINKWSYPTYNSLQPSHLKGDRLSSPDYNKQQTFAKLELSTDSSQENDRTNGDQESDTTITTVDSKTTNGFKQSNDNQNSDTDQDNNQSLKAVAVLRGKAKGTLYFEQIDEKVHVTGTIDGLTNGLHAFHVHDYGDLTRSCESSGDHFNPHKTKHGSPFDSVRHVGDLGNVFADESGVATIDIQDKFLSLKAGKNNILGHTIIVHENVDDLGRGGHVKAGRRIGCGIIGWRNELA